jgi:hypothetical protein
MTSRQWLLAEVQCHPGIHYRVVVVAGTFEGQFKCAMLGVLVSILCCHLCLVKQVLTGPRADLKLAYCRNNLNLFRRLLLPCRERYRLSSVSDHKMRWRMKVPGYLSLLLLGSLLFSVTATASELRGSFRGYQGAKIPNNTTIHVSCGSASLSTGLNPNGSYSIRGLPASSGCSYRVNFEDGAASKSISFNSGNGVVTINGSLRKHGNTILVIAN